MSVLVVDDDPMFREAIGELLHVQGFHVAGHAGNEDETLSAVRRLQPAGVLLDVRLPGRDGFQVACRLAALESPPTVVLTSSDSDAANQSLAHKCGAVAFVPKSELATADLGSYFSSGQSHCCRTD
jgi:DNA-binding NarL/FixJ family response regulator